MFFRALQAGFFGATFSGNGTTINLPKDEPFICRYNFMPVFKWANNTKFILLRFYPIGL